MSNKTLKIKEIQYIVNIYLQSILYFTIFRFLLFFQEWKQVEILPKEETVSLMFQSFFMGFRFDTVISGYLLALPFLVLSICQILKIQKPFVFKSVYYFTTVAYLLAFAICAMDIPYFHQFYARFSVSAFTWMETPSFVAKMIFQDISSWWTLFPFLIISYFFTIKNKELAKKYLLNTSNEAFDVKNHYFISIGSFLIFGGLIFLGIRGRVAIKSPIRVGTAFFSNYPFPNKLGLNPNFTFIRSWLDTKDERQKEASFMDDEDALKIVNKVLDLKLDNNLSSPVARNVDFPDIESPKHNIVIILMESMSAAKMGVFGNPNNLTPFLDSIAQRGYFYNDFYSVGTHTFSGIYGTLMSLPTVKRQHPFRGTEIHKYSGIASTLKQHDYETIYFTTHDDQFDNIGGVLKANDFDKIISQIDYPNNKVETTLGVPDDYMFEFSLPIINEINDRGTPFCAVFMTASDHTPFFVPTYFKAKNKEKKQQIVEYADWSLEKFITLSAKEKWFDNTIFVFLGDHGVPIRVKYELPLNYHHIPLIFYAPSILSPNKFSNLGNQMDVFPSIMEMLKLPYVNNTLGVSLLNKKSPYTFFNADDKFGVLSKEYFLISKNDGNKVFYRRNELNNIYGSNKEKADSMDIYAKSMFQTAQWLVKNRKTNIYLD